MNKTFLCSASSWLVAQAQSKEIRLRLDEERKERIEKRLAFTIWLNLDGSVDLLKFIGL